MNLLKAEWIKASSLRSSWLLLAISLVLSLGFAALMAQLSGTSVDDGSGQVSEVTFTPGNMLGASFGSLGVLLVWVLAIVLITGEYRTGTIRSVFLMAPRRWDTYVVKTVFFIVAGAVITFVFSFLSLALANTLSSSSDLAPWSGDGFGAVVKFTIYVAISMFLIVGVSTLLRNMAGTIVLVIAWIFIVEGLVGTIPKIGDDIARWMPFVNGQTWAMGGSSGDPTGTSSANVLSSPGNIIWFAVVALVIWVAGLFVLRSRDA